MSETSILVTGACGEIGQALVQSLAKRGFRIVTADLVPLPETIKSLPTEHIQGDLVNRIKIFYDYGFDIIFHRQPRSPRKPKWRPRKPTASTWKAQCNC